MRKTGLLNMDCTRLFVKVIEPSLFGEQFLRLLSSKDDTEKYKQMRLGCSPLESQCLRNQCWLERK